MTRKQNSERPQPTPSNAGRGLANRTEGTARMTATTPLKKQIGLPPWSVHPINACPGGASLFAWSRQQHDCNDDGEPDNGSGNCEMDIPSRKRLVLAATIAATTKKHQLQQVR